MASKRGLRSPPTGIPPGDRYRRQLQATMDVAWSLQPAVGIDALLTRILVRVTELLAAERATFFMVDRERRELWSRVLHGHQPQELRLPFGVGVAGWVAAHGEPVNLREARADPRFDPAWDEAMGQPTRSLLCVPVRDLRGETIAVLQCLNRREGDFDGEDAELLSAIGAQCAIAMDKAVRHEELLEQNRALERAGTSLRRAHAELSMLHELEQQIADAADLEQLTESVLVHLCALMHARAAGLLLVRDEGAQWLLTPAGSGEVARHGMSRQQAEHALLLGRLPACRRLLGDTTALGLRRVAAFAPSLVHSVPLSDGRHQVGVLQLFDRRADALGEDEVLRQLTQVASQLGRGVAVHRERQAGERAQRLALLGDSMSALLHDMRTPMNAISGYVELLGMSQEAGARADFVERIHRALEHIEGMTQEVLAFTRGQRDVSIGKVSLPSFVDEVRELLLHEVEGLGVELAVEATFHGTVCFDATKLKRVILDLARNACQAMGEGGLFLWRISASDTHLLFECSDTGPGVPAQMEGRLFEPFATYGKPNGIGLGLAMAKKIVDAHCGRIECDSSAGRGTSFRIWLPR